MRGRGWAWTLCITFVVLALAYNALIPIGESPDELAHFEYLRLLLDQRRLPTARDGIWQGHQAPLYYVLAGAWTYAIERGPACRIEPRGLPNVLTPNFPSFPNLNFLVHPSEERLGRWPCHVWAFHLLRLLSTALAVPTILLVIATLRLAAPDTPVVAAVGGTIAALLPSQVTLSSMLNNDALINLLVIGATYLVVRACRTGDATSLAKAAVVASVAATAKLSGIYFFGLILVALALRRDLLRGLLAPGPTRRWLVAAVVAGVLPVAVLARNYAQWGDLFGVRALEANLVKLIAAGANPPHSDPVGYYLRDLPSLFANAFMVAYGAINLPFTGSVEPGRWGPRIVLAGLALSMVVRSVWRRVDPRVLAVLCAGFALFFATYFYPGYRYRWLQVRYFFNQMPLICLVAAVALATFVSAARRIRIPVPDGALVGVVYVALVGLNLLVIWAGVIPYLYRHVGAAG